MSGWLNITDGVSHLLVWRYSIVEHYTLERWNAFLRSSFPLAKGYSCGYRLFALDDAMAEWPERRKALELEAMREALSRPTNAEVRVFVKDAEELRREKYAAQQAGKAAKAPAAKADEPATKAAAPAAQKKKAEVPDTISHVDLRVGVVVAAEPHPDGDTLYVERIDVGEKEPRTIVSGIRQHVSLAQFVGARVLVMCNLKEKPLRGVNSNGMICCASRTEGDNKTVRLLEIPESAKPGDRVVWRGETAGVEADPTPIAPKKLTRLLGGLRTDAAGAVVFGDAAWPATVNGAPITCKEIVNGVVG